MDFDYLHPPPALVFVTQALLGALFVVGVGAVILLPGISSSVATSLPEYAGLRTPLLAVAMAFTVLGLVTLVMISLLVHRIYRATILTRTSLLWVDSIVASLACAVIVVLISFVVVSNGQAGSPFVALLQAMTSLTLAVLACITLVLRSLLQRTIMISAELDEVV